MNTIYADQLAFSIHFDYQHIISIHILTGRSYNLNVALNIQTLLKATELTLYSYQLLNNHVTSVSEKCQNSHFFFLPSRPQLTLINKYVYKLHATLTCNSADKHNLPRQRQN